MAYLDTTHGQSADQAARHPLTGWLFPSIPGIAARPVLQRVVKAHIRQVQQMLLAATLSAASIVAVAAALLIHS
jgi:hypothetical protein